MAIQIYEQKDFTGGLNLRSDQFQLADNESPEMLNVEVDPRGGVFSRGGMLRFNPSNVTGTWSPQKLTPFYGATNKLMLANGSKVMHLSTGNNFAYLQYSAGNDITSTSSHGACMAPWGQTLYISTGLSGTAGTYKWNGSATYATNVPPVTTTPNVWVNVHAGGTGSYMPQAEHLVVHANKMFVAGTKEDGVEYPNRIRWSNEALPEAWHQEDYIDIQGGGTGITGMVVVNGSLVIFKPNAIYILFGYSYTDFRLVQVSASIGCIDHHALAGTENGVYFYAANKGLHYFDGSNVVDLFSPLRPAFDLGYINSAAPEAISVSWVGRRVWISVPYSTSGTNATNPTVTLVYDPSLRAYTIFNTSDGYGVLGGTDFVDNANVSYRFMCHPIVPCVVRVDQYDYGYDAIAVDGTFDGFASYYRTKWFDGGTFLQRKMFRRPDLVMRETEETQSVTVDVYHDYQEAVGSQKRSFVMGQTATLSGMVWGDNWAFEPAGEDAYGSVWAADTLGGTIQTARNLGLAKTVQLRFTGELKKPWGINSIGYKWQPRRVKG